MRICLVNAVFGQALDTPEKLLSKYWHITRLAEALMRRSHNVNVVQAFGRSDVFDSSGVTITMIAADKLARVGNGNMIELTDYRSLESLLKQFDPDAVHYFGLTVPGPLQKIIRWAKRRQSSVTASFHGGKPRRNPLSRWQQRRVFRGLGALMFSAKAYADVWQSSGVVDKQTAIAIVPEVSSPFSGVPKAEARRILGIEGGPVFAWSGRLHPIKDPMTALKGFTRICKKWPEARMLMAYQAAPLLPEIQRYLQANSSINRKVTLLGELPHKQIELLFSAADFFVQTSLREYGGNSLVEAMSCGAIPLVTDIPSFQELTFNIEPAMLFACGDVDGIIAAISDVDTSQIDELSDRVRADFNRHLGYPVLAEQYEHIFESAIAEKAGGKKR